MRFESAVERFRLCFFELIIGTGRRRRRKKRRIGIGRYVSPHRKCNHRTHCPLILLQLHVQGKTDEAKTDLARLAKIRREREAAQAKRKAEAEGQHSVITTYPSPYLTLLADCSYSMSRESKGSRNQEDAADKALNVGTIPSRLWDDPLSVVSEV